MKNFTTLSLILMSIFLNGCDDMSSNKSNDVAATGKPTPECDGGGCGNGGGDEKVNDGSNDKPTLGEGFIDVPQPSELTEDQVVMDLHIKDSLSYNWKNSEEFLIENIEYFNSRRLLFSKKHTQNNNYYFYFYIDPQISSNNNLTGVYYVNLIRMFKSPNDLTTQDIIRIKEGAKAIIHNSDGTEYSHDFWTSQRIGVVLVTEQPGDISSANGQSIINRNLNVINIGPTTTYNFSNTIRATDNSILIRGELVNVDIQKITSFTDQSGLTSSPAVPDFKALPYTIEFPFGYSDKNFDGFGDISDKLDLPKSKISKK